MALSPVAIAKHAATAGWRGADLPVSVAVALASSGGQPDRAGGLWGLPGEPGGDAAGNAVAAFARWRAGGWGMFAHYRDTKWLLFMPIAVPAVAHPDVVAIVAAPVVEGFKEGAESVLPAADMLDIARAGLSFVAKAGAWMSNRHNWVRSAQVLVGAGLVIAAMGMVTRPDQTVGGFIGSTGKALGKVL
jgi:hypothetical protein